MGSIAMPAPNRGRVLITGAAGFTGHHMVMEAVKAGFTVRATDVSSRYYGAMFDALGVEFVASDLTKRNGLEALLQEVDGVFHVAGIHDYSTPDGIMFAINVGAVENICDACVATGVNRFVHLSSVAVYGYDWHGGTPVREDAPKLTPPLNNYNASKWEGEKVVHRYQKEKGLRTTILRPAAIYGTRSEYGLYKVFKQIHKDRKKKRMLMAGRGDRIEAFLHVEDLCRAVLFAFDHDSMIGEEYNISDDTRMTTAEFFTLVCKELLGVEKPFLRVPIRVLLPIATASQLVAKALGRKPMLERATLQYLCCDRVWDNGKLKGTGFTFKYPTIEVGMKETIRWYKDNGWLRV